MIHRLSFVWLALLLACLMAGCGSSKSKRDVLRYLGKSEAEITEVFGTPSAWCGLAAGETSSNEGAQPRRLMYRTPAVSLPQPYTGLDFVIAQNGLCNEVGVFTDGFKSPGELLDAVGLEKRAGLKVEEDDKAIRYGLDGAEFVEVLKPHRIAEHYADLVIVG